MVINDWFDKKTKKIIFNKNKPIYNQINHKIKNQCMIFFIFINEQNFFIK